MKIFALNFLEPIDDFTFRKLLSETSKERQERIKKLAKPDDVKRVLFADILLRSVLKNELKISNEKIEYVNNEYGKPFLKGNYGLYFNISHAGDWVVCAIDNEPIGIDIEKIYPVGFDIAARFFSDEEYKVLMAKPAEEQQPFFFDLWTLKESYIKAIGKGLTVPLNSFTISFFSNGEIAVKSGGKLSNWSLKQYNLDPEYKMSVCAAHQAFPDKIIIKGIKDIYPEFL